MVMTEVEPEPDEIPLSKKPMPEELGGTTKVDANEESKKEATLEEVEAEEVEQSPKEKLLAKAEEVKEEPPSEPEEEAKASVEPTPIRRRFAHLFAGKDAKVETPEKEEEKETEKGEVVEDVVKKEVEPLEDDNKIGMKTRNEKPKLQSEEDLFTGDDQADLFGEAKPKGRFEGESPNIHDGTDLDIPTFLR